MPPKDGAFPTSGAGAGGAFKARAISAETEEPRISQI